MKLFLFASALLLASVLSAAAQDCRAKDVTLSQGPVTLSGKTGGCLKYRFAVEQGTRAVVTLKSSDSKARFDLQDGAEDETGSSFYENLTSFDRVIAFDEFSVEVRGTGSASFTLTVKVE